MGYTARQEDEDAQPYEFGGLCPVSLSKGFEVDGDPDITTTHDGRAYAFIADSARTTFLADPDAVLDVARAAYEG
ncbi:MAG: hypothetical protein RIE08_15395 [Acidimicrobiales bacterium]